MEGVAACARLFYPAGYPVSVLSCVGSIECVDGSIGGEKRTDRLVKKGVRSLSRRGYSPVDASRRSSGSRDQSPPPDWQNGLVAPHGAAGLIK
jgi:hypothetical protein